MDNNCAALIRCLFSIRESKFINLPEFILQTFEMKCIVNGIVAIEALIVIALKVIEIKFISSYLRLSRVEGYYIFGPNV